MQAQKRTLRNVSIALIAGFIGIIFGGPIMLDQIERSLILFPSGPYLSAPPATLPAESVTFAGPEDSELHAWVVAGKNPDLAVLMAHGNAGDLSSRAPVIEAIWRVTGATVMMFDYRGYGRSTGTPTVAGVVEDALAAQKWFSDRTGVSKERMFLHGRSLGGGVMAAVAVRAGAAGLILENTFSSLPDVAKVHYPLIPAGLMLREPLDSARSLAGWDGPVLQFHGELDRTIPLAVGQRLQTAIKGEKDLMTGPGLDHNDPLPANWYRKIVDFIHRHKS